MARGPVFILSLGPEQFLKRPIGTPTLAPRLGYGRSPGPCASVEFRAEFSCIISFASTECPLREQRAPDRATPRITRSGEAVGFLILPLNRDCCLRPCSPVSFIVGEMKGLFGKGKKGERVRRPFESACPRHRDGALVPFHDRRATRATPPKPTKHLSQHALLPQQLS